VNFFALAKINARHLLFQPFSTRVHPSFLQHDGQSVFAAIRQSDILVHHPFDSFSNSVVKFLDAAAADSKVIAIKMTLYRAGGDSPVIASLKKAAENGKQVTALVELKARFDEENNIIWARELERAGVHVVYGLLGLKTHAKIAMVIRKEDQKIRTYLHLSTGNYNQSTARLYTDTGYFTAREDFASDAYHLWNLLTGYSQYSDWKQMHVAPVTLFDSVIERIEEEIAAHTDDNPGEIYVKMNSLVDDKVIRALYRASQKGVKVRLLIRGICSLRPGIKGLSENIEVRSILGRFLEHTRILYFKNSTPQYFMTSADWMPRNLYRRVELLFPIIEQSAQQELQSILDIYWKDNTKSRRLHSDGTYSFVKDNAPKVTAQDVFLKKIGGK
jgi:polyphosphate kinase